MGAASVRILDKTGGTVITGKVWADIVAGVVSVAEKHLVQNDGDRTLDGVILSLSQVGTNDGINYARFGLDVGTISPPYGLAGVSEAGSVAWGGTGVNKYRLTATTALGETTGSFIELAVTLLTATDQIRLTWLKPPGASLTGYKVYRTQRRGVAQTAQLIATIADPNTLLFIDTDQAGTPATSPPATNTTAGGSPNYGTVPTLGQTALTLGNIAIGQAFAYWVNWVTTAAVSETDNPREFQVVASETF